MGCCNHSAQCQQSAYKDVNLCVLRCTHSTSFNTFCCYTAYSREAEKLHQSPGPVARTQHQPPLLDFTLSPRSAAGRTSGTACNQLIGMPCTFVLHAKQYASFRLLCSLHVGICCQSLQPVMKHTTKAMLCSLCIQMLLGLRTCLSQVAMLKIWIKPTALLTKPSSTD